MLPIILALNGYSLILEFASITVDSDLTDINVSIVSTRDNLNHSWNTRKMINCCRGCCILLTVRGGAIAFEVGVQNYFARSARQNIFYFVPSTVEILIFAFSQTANDVQNKIQA
jgi:hypothetical protein